MVILLKFGILQEVVLMERNRCSWVNLNNPQYVNYHDNEFGILTDNNYKLWEYLVLEIMQAGLSFECILNKREDIRKSFSNFDYYKIKNYNKNKLNELLSNKNIIRNKLKIEAIINNSQIFINIINEYSNFLNYLKQFNNANLVSDITKDLKRRGMKFIGPVIIKSYLEAIGLIDGHEKICFLHKKL